MPQKKVAITKCPIDAYDGSDSRDDIHIYEDDKLVDIIESLGVVLDISLSCDMTTLVYVTRFGFTVYDLFLKKERFKVDRWTHTTSKISSNQLYFINGDFDNNYSIHNIYTGKLIAKVFYASPMNEHVSDLDCTREFLILHIGKNYHIINYRNRAVEPDIWAAPPEGGMFLEGDLLYGGEGRFLDLYRKCLIHMRIHPGNEREKFPRRKQLDAQSYRLMCIDGDTYYNILYTQTYFDFRPYYILMLLPVLRVLCLSLARQYSLIFPTGILKEVIKYIVPFKTDIHLLIEYCGNRHKHLILDGIVYSPLPQ